MKGRTEGYLLLAIGLGALLNALIMLVASEPWFEAVAHHTGAFNVHLIRDVAFAYATTGVALVWAALRAELRAGARRQKEHFSWAATVRALGDLLG